MKEKEPFDRMMLKQLNKKSYVKKLEYIIVEEGKRILQSLKIGFMIVSSKNISKFVEKYPDFKVTTWHQIGLENIFKKYRILNTFQYQLLITMKQILNKNGKYLLMKNQFENREYVLSCKHYKEVDVCYNDDCRATYECPKFYKLKEK